MVFTTFTANTLAESAKVNANFQDNPYQAPVGSVVAWLKTFANTPALPLGWVECDGSVLSDADSVYDGETIPDINGSNQFLRGNITSGGTGGAATHQHNMSGDSGNGTIGGSNKTDFQSNIPPYYEVVFIMRIK